MAALGMSNIDLECGCAISDEEASFSDAVKGSCNSQFASNYDDCSSGCGSEDEDLGQRKNVERDCRICHLSLESSSPSSGIAIELGCSCKDDLAAAHRHCAETWFKIKGNKSVPLLLPLSHDS